MSEISAKVICHSITEDGGELITLQTRSPKFLDAEIMTHRMISTSSSSDRAIPFKKMVNKEFFLPEDVRINESGMQGYVRMNEKPTIRFRANIEEMYGQVLDTLEKWEVVHKQHLNRYLIPFSYQDKVMTANKEWFEYFFSLREAEDADPAIQKLAKKMREAIEDSTPSVLKPGEWHLPYIRKEERYGYPIGMLKSASVMRCARASYSKLDGGESDLVEDSKSTHIKLFLNRHMKPYEHVATPMGKNLYPIYYEEWEKGITHMDKYGELYSGNFKHFIQFRQLL